jgi:hypothetical protein
MAASRTRPSDTLVQKMDLSVVGEIGLLVERARLTSRQPDTVQKPASRKASASAT